VSGVERGVSFGPSIFPSWAANATFRAQARAALPGKSQIRLDCSRSVPRHHTSAVTKRFASRSPAIQLPIFRKKSTSPSSPPSSFEDALPHAIHRGTVVQECVSRTKGPVGVLLRARVSLVGVTQQIGHDPQRHTIAAFNCSSAWPSILVGVSCTLARGGSSSAANLHHRGPSCSCCCAPSGQDSRGSSHG